MLTSNQESKLRKLKELAHRLNAQGSKLSVVKFGEWAAHSYVRSCLKLLRQRNVRRPAASGAPCSHSVNVFLHHAQMDLESLQIEFDPSKISYDDILDFFFRLHDPTTANRQGNDIGTQYRSAIFYHDDAQRDAAQRAIQRAQSKWPRPIVTEVVPFTNFYPAEDFHQDYLQRNPHGYTCHYLR